MSKTATEIIAFVKQRIGNRATGNIGGTPIDDVLLDTINTVIMRLNKRDDVPTLSCIATLDLTTSDVFYALPTTDQDGAAIRFKTIEQITCRQVASIASWTLEHLLMSRMNNLYPLRIPTLIARPTYYAYQDIAKGITLNCYPNVNITATIFGTSWPAPITVNQNSPYPAEWDNVIEAFATADAFEALQLSEDAQRWNAIAESRLQETLYAIRMQPDYNPKPSPSRHSLGSSTAWPGTDPNVRSM